MIKKKILLLSIIVLSFLNLGFAASKNVKMKDFIPDQNNVRLLGRTICENQVAILAHSATGIEFNVNAKRLTVTMVEDSWSRQSRIVAFFNGERILDEMLRSNIKEFVIFDSDEVKQGVVQILKVTESTWSNVGIKKVSTDKNGSISPTAPKDIKIEFIGDSATAGYGVDETDFTKHFRVETEDITKTYAYKAALALDADFSIICASGWGVVSGATGWEKRTDMLIPDIYGKVGTTKDVAVGTVKPGEMEWDFAAYKPDIIMVLLGANDQSYTKHDEDKKKEYKDAYVEFIKDIRNKNPDSYILCCLGLAPDYLYPEMLDAVSDYKAQTNDSNVGSFKLSPHNGQEDGFGADYHPTEKAYERAAKELIPKLESILK